MSNPKLYPIQGGTGKIYSGEQATVREGVYMAAYEVYSHVFAPQKALIENGCRGGFSKGELVAFLYARAFPKEQWSKRVDEALEGMKL